MDVSFLRYENRSELASLLRSLRGLVHPTGFERYDCRGIITAPWQAYECGKVYGTLAQRIYMHYPDVEESFYSAGRLYQGEGLVLPSSVPGPMMQRTGMSVRHIGSGDVATADFVINNFIGERADHAFEKLVERVSSGYQGRITMTVGYARPGIMKSEKDIDTVVQTNREHIVCSIDHAEMKLALKSRPEYFANRLLGIETRSA